MSDDVVHGLPTGGTAPCGVHYMAPGAIFGTVATCPGCLRGRRSK